MAQLALPNVPARPVGGGMAMPMPAPQQQRQPGTVRTSVEAPVPPSARPPDQPDGGFAVVPPSPGKEDPAQRMNLRNAGSAVGAYGSSADATLGSMTQGALPNPQIKNESDLVDLQQVQRQMQLLEAKEKLAEIAVKYWGTVFNNDNAKAWREQEAKKAAAEEEKNKKAQAEEEQRQKMAALQASMQPTGPVAPPEPKGQVYDVMGSRAGVIVPGSGITYVARGDRLPDGSVVDEVDAGGVTVTSHGKRYRLGMAPAMTAKR